VERLSGLGRPLTLVLACACGLLLGCGAEATRPARLSGISLTSAHERSLLGVARAHSSSGSEPFRFFSPEGLWNKPLAAKATLDPGSAAFVQALEAEVAAELPSGRGPWINTTSYSVPIYTVAAGQPTVRVQLVSSRPERGLQLALDAVPLPPTALPARGTDAELVLWQPSKNRLWEFWRLAHTAAGWQASWGGAMRHVSSNPGVYGLKAWPESKPWWGAAATSLSLAGGLITLEDLRFGQIRHALAMALPEVRTGVYSSPAQRGDGTSANPLSLPEGARLRLNPKLDLASLHLPPLTMMIAEAAQRYGILVRDKGGNVQFFAQDPTPTGSDPYKAAGGYFGGLRPSQLLASFPWSQLQVLKLSLHRNGASAEEVRRAERQASKHKASRKKK
jgi:hypothetical protein